MTLSLSLLRSIFRGQRYCIQHPKKILIFAFITALLIGGAAPLIKTSNDIFMLFGSGNTHRVKLEQQQAEFGRNQRTMLLLATELNADFTDVLAAERYVSALLTDDQNPLRPSNLVDFASITRLLPALGHPTEFTSIDQVAMLIDEQPALNTSFVNKARSATILSLNLDVSDLSDQGLKIAYAEQEALKQHIESLYPNVKTAFLGSVSLSEALRGAMTFDRRYLFPLTLLVNFVVLFLAFGNLRITVASLGASVVSVVLTLGVAGWSGHVFATAAVSSFSIVMTLTVASLIHVIHAVGQRQRRLDFQSNRSNILASFRKLSVPIIVAHATTAVGFLSLNWADAPAFHAMGNLVAIGLGFSLFIVLFLSPVVICYAGGNGIIRDHGLRKLSNWMISLWSRAPVLWASVMAFAAIVALVGLVKTTFNDQFEEFFANDHPLRQDLNLIGKQFGWADNMDLVLRYDPDELLTTDSFVTLKALVDDIKQMENVSEVLSPLEILNNCLENRTPPYFGALNDVPSKMLNFCIRSNWLTTQESGNSTFAADFRALRVVVLLPSVSSHQMRNIAEDVEALTKEYGFNSQTAAVSGIGVVSAYLSKINTESMLQGSAIAMLIVSILIGVFLGSVRLALLSIVPNFLPAMAALGLWVWFNGEVGMAASVIAALTFGIVVDDTIHILYALNRNRSRQKQKNVPEILQNVIPGVLTTTAVLGLGFALIMLSGFAVNQQLGFLTSATVFIAFLFDLFVLPSLFLLFIHKKSSRI